MDSSPRSMTATTGRTVLAIVAILSLLLSAFAIARPVIAAHDDGTPEVPGYRDETRENEGGNITNCLYGATLVRFESAEASGSASGTIDGIPYTIEYTITDGKLTFVATGALVTEALIKGGPATTIYDYSGFPGGGIAHDDGLFATEGGISNVGFCLIPIEASILVYKTDQTDAAVAGAEFTVYDGDTAVGGPTATDASGYVCFDGLVLDKTYTVIETDAPDGYIGDPDSQTVAAALGNCEDRIAQGDEADAIFTNTLLGAIVIYKTDQTGADVVGATFTVEGKEGTFLTGADGTFCVDGLAVNDVVTVTETIAPDGYELANPASQDVTVTQAGDCDDHDGTPDATFTNNLLGSLLVLKTDEADDPLAGAEFSITGPGEFADTATSDADGWFCIDGLTYGAEYTVTETDAPDGYQMDANNPQTHVIDDSATCAERVADSPTADLVFVNAEDEEEPTGSITIDKQLDECETCEAYTPGYWFNRGGGGGVDWANDWLGANPQTIAGIGTFDSVGSVQAYLDADTAGDDGEKGLSATGQLLRHYLALVLNVAFAEANDCDLASLTYGDGTIAEWLAAALAALESDASDDDKREIKDALDAINNSDAGDGTLECGESEAGPHAGVMFELYDAADQLVDSGTTGADGSLVLDGDPDGTGLPLGTYTLVEVSNDAELECTIVSVSGDGATLNEDGTVTIVLTEENADVTITVVNDCEEQPGAEDEFGHISVVKETDEAEATESFSFTATWDADGFTLMDGDLEPSGDLLAGVDYTVTEVLSPAQVAAGWSLDDIECTGAATWSVSGDGMSVTITLGADEDVVCTFTNELADQPGEGVVEIDKLFCITSGEAETEFFVFDPTVPGEIDTLGVAEEQPDEGCWSEDVAFTITGGDLTEPIHVTTGDDGILEVDLPASENAYLITEDLSGASDEFWVEEGAVTVILVINWIPEEAENGTVKVIKLFCETDDAAEAGVEFQVEGADVAVPVLQGCTVGDATFEFGDDTFSVGADGLAIFTAEVGEYDFAEIAPNAAVYAGTVPVVEGEYTTVIVFNTFVEDEQGGGGGGVTPGQSQTPREGTAGGNPLPNTATTPAPGGSLPAILLALMALGALTVGGQRMAAEARNRR
jgi:hypothetical protein